MGTAVAMSGDDALAQRRRAIVVAADDLLAENGLDGLTIRAVLARTGLARRAFYDLFETKDDLVLAVFEHALADAAEQLEREGQTLEGPEQRLTLIVQSIVTSGAQDTAQELVRRDRRSAAFSLEHLRLAQARPAQLQSAIDPLVTLIRHIIVEGIEQGLWTSASPERAARFVYNLVSTTVHTEMLDPGSQRMSREERGELAEQLTTFCLRALSGN